MEPEIIEVVDERSYLKDTLEDTFETWVGSELDKSQSSTVLTALFNIAGYMLDNVSEIPEVLKRSIEDVVQELG